MKNYEYGFYGISGEFFELREFGFYDGRKYYLTAENDEQAYTEFLGKLDVEFCGSEMLVREIPAGHDMSDYIRL